MFPVNGIRLFKIFGITVYLHWSWFLIAFLMIEYRAHEYSSPAWNIAEYLSIFVIVLLHEFGHALACRSVGGRSERIVLWPLGGVAYANPPQRPGALLWTIVAGPLVNVALLPITFGLPYLFPLASANVQHFLSSLAKINLVLLVFNILPVYPLDGGQIVQALLWFVIGQARSLVVSSVIGLIGSALLGIYGLMNQDWWLAVIAMFVGSQSMAGFARASAIRRRAAIPRRVNAACSACKQAPPVGAWWICSQCHLPFDTFATGSVCSNCGRTHEQTSCTECRVASPYHQWLLYAVPLLEPFPQTPGYQPVTPST